MSAIGKGTVQRVGVDPDALVLAIGLVAEAPGVSQEILEHGDDVTHGRGISAVRLWI